MDKRKVAGINRKVDKAVAITSQIAKLEAELDAIKTTIRAFAEANEIRDFEGKVGMAHVAPQSSIKVDPMAAYNGLVELSVSDPLSSFMDLVEVKSKKAKMTLGAGIFDRIAERKIVPYGKVTVKPLK